jgi:hypothetical protein
VTIDVSSSCSDASCPSAYFESCSTYFPLVEAATERLDATSAVDPEHVTALVQLQYGGPAIESSYGPDHPHQDYTLARTDRVDVYPMFDADQVLYRIDANGAAVDLDTTRLVSSDGQTLEFTYQAAGTIVETHVLAAPRLVAVEASSPGPLDACCSVGRPGDLGMVIGALVFVLRRRSAKPARRVA